MERCEGYFRLENRRCDRPGTRDLRAADGQVYRVCEHHAHQVWTASVAHWHGQSELRSSTPTPVRPNTQPPRRFALT